MRRALPGHSAGNAAPSGAPPLPIVAGASAVLIEIYADTRRRGVCRSCHAPIEWATVVNSGRSMPFNAPIVPVRTQPPLYGDEREVHVVDTTRSIAHFTTCPQSTEWRKAR